MGNVQASDMNVPITVPVGPKPEGSTEVRRHPMWADKELVRVPFADQPFINTAWHVFDRSRELHGARPCLGRRPIIDGEAQDYVWETYAEVNDQVRRLGTALANLKLQPGDPVSIFSINRPEWIKTLLALWSQSLVCVPLYDTLGAESVEYILNDAEVTTVFLETSKLDRLLQVAAKCPSLRTIIAFDPVGPELEKQLAEQAPGIKLLDLQTIIAGAPADGEARPPTPDLLAYIMYTSGTTGNPKGVMLTHENVLASASGLFASGVELYPDDVYFSYLPLAHSFETVMQIGGLIAGGSVGFFQGDIKKLTDDIMALRPTVFAGVPRVYSRIYDRVMQQVAASSWIKRSLFETAFENQAENLMAGQERTKVWDMMVFSKTAQRLGGRVRLMATGAAPMPAHLHTFLQVVFMAPVLQGYGLTENAAAACVTPLGYRIPGRIGGPLPCTEVKLVDIPEMNYLSTDQPHPRGEICLRGGNVFKGYFKLEDKTKEALDDEGWLHTGDVGILHEDGSFQIIDRRKSLFKLAQGEYVAPEELENIFCKVPCVGQCFVYGDSFKNVLVAVVVPDVEVLKAWAQEHEVAGNFEALCADERAREHVYAAMVAEAKANKVAGFKIPKAIHLEGRVDALGNGFTVDNNCMTPTFKLRRPQLKERYHDAIDALYQALGEGAVVKH